MEAPTITRHGTDARGRYKAHVADSTKFGVLTWVQQGDVRVAEHTLVPPELGGRGIAAQLVEALIADAREQGFKVKPECSYVVKAFEKHPEWADLKA